MISQSSGITGVDQARYLNSFPSSSGPYPEATISSPVYFGVDPWGPQQSPLPGLPNEAGTVWCIRGPAGLLIIHHHTLDFLKHKAILLW